MWTTKNQDIRLLCTCVLTWCRWRTSRATVSHVSDTHSLVHFTRLQIRLPHRHLWNSNTENKSDSQWMTPEQNLMIVLFPLFPTNVFATVTLLQGQQRAAPFDCHGKSDLCPSQRNPQSSSIKQIFTDLLSQLRETGKVFSRHITIHSHTANKKVVNTINWC